MGARSRRRVPVAALVLAGLAATACAQRADDGAVDVVAGGSEQFAATAGYLSRAAHETAAEPYRVEMRTTIDAPGMEAAAGVGRAEIDGDRASLTFDLGEPFTALPGMEELDGADTTVSMIAVPGALYIRAPVFAALRAHEGTGGLLLVGGLGPLTELGDRWGRIDTADVGDLPTGVLGSPEGDPRQLLDALERAGDTRDLGNDTIRGVPVRGVGGTLPLKDLVGEIGDLPPDAPESLLAALGGPMAIEVWVDAQDRIRRIETTQRLGEHMPSVTSTTDFFDYGDPSISVEAPEGAVDITDKFPEPPP